MAAIYGHKGRVTHVHAISDGLLPGCVSVGFDGSWRRWVVEEGSEKDELQFRACASGCIAEVDGERILSSTLISGDSQVATHLVIGTSTGRVVCIALQDGSLQGCVHLAAADPLVKLGVASLAVLDVQDVIFPSDDKADRYGHSRVVVVAGDAAGFAHLISFELSSY
jgi:hypothetical protein